MGVMGCSYFHYGAVFGDAVNFIHRIEDAVQDLYGVLANDHIKSAILNRPRQGVDIVNDVYTISAHTINTDSARSFCASATNVEDCR